MSPSDMPDFENMSPDEMMRWMESLAKRQGANTEELTTSADAEIGEVDASTFVDETPGYVPYGEKAPPKPEPAAAKPEPAPAPPPPDPEPEPEPEPPAPEPVAAGGSGEMDFDNMSPDEMMRWMESLAKRQGANTEELLTSADADIAEVDESTFVDETPGYVPFGETAPFKPARSQQSQPAPPTPDPPAPEPAPVAGDDMDFLSSLTSGGDLGTDFPDFDSLGAELNDLPDLSDLDALAADLDLGDTAGAPAGGDTDAMSWLEGLTSSQPDPTPDPPAVSVPEPSDEVSNPLDAGVDPMAWLEGLARNQGAKDEELLTGGGTPPATSMPSVLEETSGPGYEPYSVDDEGMDDASDPAAWLQGLAGTDAVDEPASEPVLDATDPAAWLGELAGTDDQEDVQDASDPAAWLGGLAGTDDQQEDVQDASDPAAWLGGLMDDPDVASRVPGFDPNPRPVEADRPATGDPIADMLNRGETPSPEAMQAWMSGKMDELLNAEPLPIDEDDEEDDTPPAFDPDAPAVQGDIPDWLTGMAPSDDTDAAAVESAFDLDAQAAPSNADMFIESPATDAPPPSGGMPDFLSMTDAAPGEDFFGTGVDSEPSPLLDEIETPPDVIDMPDWLRQDVPMGGDTLMDIFDTAEDQAVPPDAAPPPSTEIDKDMVARFTPEGGAFEQDPWVQALQEEQQYNYQTDSLPDWYEQRISDPQIRAQFEQLGTERQTLADANLPVEAELPVGQREPLPDWFNVALGAAPATPPLSPAPEAPSGDVPDWLVESVGEGPSGGSDLPDWLMTDADTANSDIPAWLTESLPEDTPELAPAPQRQPEPAPQRQPEPQPVRQVTPAAPPQRSPVPVPQSAQIDVAATLQDAQQRQGSGDIDGALQRYEQVVRANAQLDAVESAVTQILGQKEHKENPAAHRILGDSLMRQGKLQAALDTYRKALNLL